VANLNLRRSSIDDEEEPAAAGLTVAGFNMEPLARVSNVYVYSLCVYIVLFTHTFLSYIILYRHGIIQEQLQ